MTTCEFMTKAVLAAAMLVGMAAPLDAQANPRWVDTSAHHVQFVTVGPDVRLEVLDWGGNGPPLLFLAGLDDTGHEFDDFAPKWTKQFHVLALTRRGFGASTQPKSGYQIDSLANDIRVVLDSLHIDRVILVGHSLAGDELTRFASSWPDRVSRLVYFDAAHDRVPLREMSAKYPAPAPPTMTAGDSATPVAFQEYNYRAFGVRMTLGEILSIAVFGPDGRYLRDVTPATVDSSILSELEHPRYAAIRAPALAFYVVYDSVPQLFPTYAQMDSANRVKARRFFEAFGPWATGERVRFTSEMRQGRAVEIHGAHHYVFMSNEAQVMREMMAFLESDP